MNEIAQAKAQIRLQNWQLMYSEYASSGLTVKEWCENNHLSVKTFYYRLKRLRTEALKQEQHDIVAVKQNTDMNTLSSENTGFIRISGRGITAELPQNISPELLTTLLKGLSAC
ncbi:MAG: IS66 family insertion sequence element accessory protein TnpA [Acutalibacteraceae bacterium]